MSRRVITISRKKWGKSAAKTERIVRDAILKADTMSGIDEYLQKAKSVTSYDLANRFNIRISVARNILREKEAAGVVVPYIREGGFVVYTTPAEIEKREGGAPIMVADALQEVASSVPKKKVITDKMDVALVAAGTPGDVKPSRLTRKRREAGAKKERKDDRPEVIVEPLTEPEVATTTPPEVETAKKAAPKKKTPAKKKDEKKAAPKKKAPAKKKAEEKKPAKKTVKKKEEPKKKAPAKKKTETKAAPKKKAPAKKKDEKKAAPKKKAPAKKKAEAKKPAKKTTTKKAAEKKPAKKKPAKK